ncbi:hypothetical protein HON36_06020 [Candidatus Parcubacteria bacterium]|jgi:hypothetical protein|nr:hypothetical protein [Candidatus Parcubacteria bacterium]MBT7227958.1 hypothetical protein [Candidatus Parcubacteria bacterium]
MTTLETYPLVKKPFKKITANKFWIASMVFAVVLLLPQVVSAGMGDKIAVGIGQIVYYIGVAFPAWILMIELKLLPMIGQYNDFTRENGVVVGWTALRDLANMFFILILLIISFATILRIDRFGYRQLLSKLIIMAVLINFSMTITGLLIDFSQVIMLTFIDAVKDVTAGNIMVSLGLGSITSFGEQTGSVQGIDFLKAVLLGSVMMVIAVVVVAAFMLVLTARIVKLWILIVVSPMVFLAYAFPLTEKYYSQWVDELTKQLISGPTLAFFLWLSFTIVGSGNVSDNFTKYAPPGDNGSEISAAASTPNIVNYVISISMLVGALGFAAQQNSAAAALSNKFKSGSKKLGGMAAKRVWQGGRSAGGAGGVKGAFVSAGGVVAGKLRGLGVGMQGKDKDGNDKKGKGNAVLRKVLGGAGRKAERAGIEGEAHSAAAASTRDKGMQEAMKNMNPAQQKRYLELKGGDKESGAAKGRFSGGDSARRLMIQMNMDSGHYDTDAGAEQVQDDYKFLEERGGMESHETMKKMKSKYAVLDDSSEADIAKDIATGKVESVDFSGWQMPDGSINTNARKKMDALVDGMDSKDLQALFDRMNKRQQDAFKDVMANMEAQDIGLTKGVNADGSTKEDDKTHKARMFMMNNDAKGSTALFDKIAAKIGATGTSSADKLKFEKTRDSLATARSGTKFDTSTLLKADAGSSYVTSMAGLLTAGQLGTVASEGTREQRQAVVDEHITGGGQHLSTILANKPLGDLINETTIQQNFKNQIDAAPDPAVMATKLAKGNLNFAQQVYPDPKDLAKFINDNLKVDEAVKIDTSELKKAWVHLDVAMQTALEKKGVTGPGGSSGSGGGGANTGGGGI